MLLHTAWLKNGQLISNGAGTAWKITLVKEGLPLSPLRNHEKIHDMFLTDLCLTERFIATELGISQERVHAIIHNHLEMTKVSARWVPKLLGPDQKRLRCNMSKNNLAIFDADPQ